MTTPITPIPLINQYTVILPGQNINCSDSEAFGILHRRKDYPGIYFDLTTFGGWRQYWGYKIYFSWIPTQEELNKLLSSVIKLTKDQYEELIGRNQLEKKTSVETNSPIETKSPFKTDFPFSIDSEILWEQKQENENPEEYNFEDEDEEIEEDREIMLDWENDSYQDN